MCLSSRHYRVICGSNKSPILKPPLIYQGFCPPSQMCINNKTTSLGLQVAYCVDAERYRLDYTDLPSTQTPHKRETTHQHIARHISKRDESGLLNRCRPPFRTARFRSSRCLSRTHFEIICRSMPEQTRLVIDGFCLPPWVCVDTTTRQGSQIARCVKRRTHVAVKTLAGLKMANHTFKPSNSRDIAPSDHAPQIAKRNVRTSLDQCRPPFRNAHFEGSQCLSHTHYRVTCGFPSSQEPHATYDGICPRLEVCINTHTQQAVRLAYCASATDYVATHSINPSRIDSSYGLGMFPGIRFAKRKSDTPWPLNKCEPPYRAARFFRSVCFSRKHYEVTCRPAMDEYIAGQNPYLTYEGNCLPSQVCVDSTTRLGNQLAFCVEEESHGAPHSIGWSYRSHLIPTPHSPHIVKRNTSTTNHHFLHIAKREPSMRLDRCSPPRQGNVFERSRCRSSRVYEIQCMWLGTRSARYWSLQISTDICPPTHICVSGAEMNNRPYSVAYCVSTENFTNERFMRYAQASIARSKRSSSAEKPDCEEDSLSGKDDVLEDGGRVGRDTLRTA